MRKAVLATSIVAALLAGSQTAAWAAPEAPTDVQVGWAADGKLRVSWQDSGTANFVRVEYPDLTQVLELTDAGGPNEVLLPGLAERDRVRLTVTSRVDGVESAATPSAWFDTLQPAAPKVEDANLLANLSTTISWSQAAAAQDTTPNDPLDRPSSYGWIKATISGPGTDQREVVSLPAGTTTMTIPSRPRPYSVAISGGNEWGLQMPQVPTRQRVVVGTMAAGIAVPAQGSFGDYLGIESRLDMYKCSCAEHRTSGIPVDLQARPTATTTWKTVGRFSGDTVAPFRTPIGSVGGRQFRLYVPATKRVDQLEIILTPASSTSARSSKTLAKFDVAGFNVTSAQVGQMVKLTVAVRPGGTVKGALQRWDGKYWRSVLTVPVTKGKAVMYVRAAGRGTTTYYRVAVPGMTYYGLPIETTGSRTFKLTVR
ncbi:hypothetical protein [Kribbella sp. NBC_00359]|uniref:hypothetical protein n=1 Tax=Kribbella sp. NBC_00359 TaxID=2975966 RepID=UPI002E23A74E